MREIERIANAFAGSERLVDTARAGWGQFIGGANTNQVGLYGTCASLICYGYASRAPDPRVVAYLDDVWTSPTPKELKYLSQTARLAFLVLALSVFPGGASKSTMDNAIAALKQRRLEHGLWPAWDVPGNHNQKSNIVASSLALIALQKAAQSDSKLGAQLLQSANELAKQLPSLDSGQPCPLLPLCAIGLTLGAKAAPRIARVHMKREIRRERSTSEIEFEFIDYGVLQGEVLSYNRDYFYVPAVALQLALSSILAPSSVVAYETADRLSERVIKAIGPNGFKREHSEYVASLDQAWVVWALSLYFTRQKPSLFRLKALFYRFVSSDKPLFIRDFLLPIFIGLTAAIANQNPQLILRTACRISKAFSWYCTSADQAAITELEQNIQFCGIVISFLFGSLFIWRLAIYCRYLYNRFSR